jgi:hypothetical protein
MASRFFARQKDLGQGARIFATFFLVSFHINFAFASCFLKITKQIIPALIDTPSYWHHLINKVACLVMSKCPNFSKIMAGPVYFKYFGGGVDLGELSNMFSTGNCPGNSEKCTIVMIVLTSISGFFKNYSSLIF